ncbi:MAG TPA: 2-amino-4-hydroxy-6-hydroxymethyldihydropteridine diphosphokinase [Longimicrobiales bacterium]|nr:2-amino-4-hydroxy-6-hydroxymethyldihydropteridine diphosphokinase [Longimicrobiales bacterium]
MSARRAYVALGSNIDPARHLPEAVRRLEEAVGVEAASTAYETEPVDAPGTPRFLNAAVRVPWTGTPHGLRERVLRRIEDALGRVRTEDPNAPRTIDLDLVLVPGLILEDPDGRLWLPDPELERRAHLAVPLAEIAPAETHPHSGRTFEEIAEALASEALRPRPDVRLG